MKNYYEQLKKIQNAQSLDKTQLKDYIHQQKNEVCSLLALSPDFWIVIDYIIYLTGEILKKPKNEAEKDFIDMVKPVFDRYNSRIEKVFRKIPENEFFYLKKDMKSFHHLISHSINLVDKGFPHFIPSYIFIDSIENMTVLFPLLDKCCDHGTLVRKDYNTLISRYVSESFAPDIKKIINYMIWLKTILPHVIPDDRSSFRLKMISMIETFVSSRPQFIQDPDYSTKDLVIELRDVITISYIQEKMTILLDRMKTPGATVPISECLEHIASIFINVNTANPYQNTVRDLSLLIKTVEKIILSIKNNDDRNLFINLLTAKSLKDFYLKVTRYMLNLKADLELCKVFEITDFIHDNYPVTTFSNELCEILEKSKDMLEKEREIICTTHSIVLNIEAMNLFKAKMRQMYSKT